MDSNIAVVAAAIDASEALAKGLRRDFRSEARMLTPHLLDKLKDKTTNVIRAIQAALSAFHTHCYTLGGASHHCHVPGCQYTHALALPSAL